MLRNLHVKNLALMDEMEVEFEEGLNILTGETGAGKSLIIGSINMALGQKVTKEMLKEGAREALVELIFEVKDEKTIARLEELDIFPEDGQVIMSRKITGTRSVAKINSESMPAAKVKEAAQLLIDIHGQHEHQSLIKKKKQLALLDDYAGGDLWKIKEQVKRYYEEYTGLKRELEEKDIDKEQQNRELSFLEYEIAEIEKANLREGEDLELEELYKKMVNSKRIAEACGSAYRMTSGESESATEQTTRALRELGTVSGYDQQLESLEEQLTQIDSLLNDFNREMADYLESLEFEEEEFHGTQMRLDEINHLKSKYGDSIEKILEVKSEKEERLGELQNYEVYLNGLKEKLSGVEKKLEESCGRLSKLRQKYAKELSGLIRTHLLDLNFETVELTMQFDKTEHFTPEGYDEAEFLISTNPGEEMKPLSKVASGGELSRIMLALKTVLAEDDEIETLIFDEIDTGISGRTAQKVSEKMNLIGKNHQVICITHLPQIAAMADTHFLIEKQVEDGRTRSQIQRLEEEESVKELARMLGGVSITETVVNNAREMKELALKTKKS